MAGQYYDGETGLHYNYHRYFDPRTGRYLTPDPIGLDGGINLYTYVENDPVNWVDPYGLFLDSTGAYTGAATIAAETTGVSVAAASGAIAVGAAAGVGAYYGTPTALEYYGLDIALQVRAETILICKEPKTKGQFQEVNGDGGADITVQILEGTLSN